MGMPSGKGEDVAMLGCQRGLTQRFFVSGDHTRPGCSPRRLAEDFKNIRRDAEWSTRDVCAPLRYRSSPYVGRGNIIHLFAKDGGFNEQPYTEIGIKY